MTPAHSDSDLSDFPGANPATASAGRRQCVSRRVKETPFVANCLGEWTDPRVSTSRLRLSALACLQVLVRCGTKKVLYGYWPSFVPSKPATGGGNLLSIVFLDPLPKGISIPVRGWG